MHESQGIRTEALTIGYDSDLIKEITFAVRGGEIVSVIGPNGCGKSTLLKTLAGHLKERGGFVYLDGKKRTSFDKKEIAKRLSMVMTERINPELMTCRDVVATGRYPYTGHLGILSESDQKVIEEALNSVDAQEIADRLFSNISDGQRQRIMLARAVAQEPDILILDEPTSYLDLKYRIELLTEIRKLTKEKGIAVLLSIHELEAAMRISDTVVAMNREGVQRIGSVEEVFTESFIRKLYGIEGMDVSILGSVPWKVGYIKKPCVNTTGKAKVIMVQGTMSNVGKSLLAAALCRIFTEDGYRTAPFKSQNMALNSYVTKDGLEMGRAQVMQAECCRREPAVEMNPILLKPVSDHRSQVIVNGRPVSNMNVKEYYAYKKDCIPVIIEAFGRLSETSEIIVVEGAGSPAELNLKDGDIVNMGLAALLSAPVILVGDIDRGGIFAQLIGTVDLLEVDERERIAGLVVNKFRGDEAFFAKGIEILESKTKKPVLGTIPYLSLLFEEEDSLSDRLGSHEKKPFQIAVVRLPHMANYTDFATFDQLEDVGVSYTDRAEDLMDSDLILLPGTKNTIEDLRWLKKTGLYNVILSEAKKEKLIIGICGGYQILGKWIRDPAHTECGGEEEGLGLLDMETVFGTEKIRTVFEGVVEDAEESLAALRGCRVKGYEIHMGNTRIAEGMRSFTSGGTGCCKGTVYGTYVHGFFDCKEIAAGVLRSAAAKSRKQIDTIGLTDYVEYKDKQYAKLAATVRAHLDMKKIYEMMGLPYDKNGTV